MKMLAMLWMFVVNILAFDTSNIPWAIAHAIGDITMQQQQHRQIRIGTILKVSAQKTVVIGDPGSGKTHLLSEFERSFFIPVEGGTTGFSPAYVCHFFEHDDETGTPIVPRSLADLIGIIRRFRDTNVPGENKQRPYAHLMLDSYSAIEDLIHLEVCRQNGARSLEDSEYGPKLYNATIPLWRQFLAELDAVVSQCGTSVWITGHTEEENTANQIGETYKKKTLRVKGGGKSQSDVRGVFLQWADNMWLLAQQVTVKRGGRGQRTIASAGGRIILTQPGDSPGGGGYEAKSRIRVPERIPAAQEDIRSAMRAGVTRLPARVRAEIESLLKQLPEPQAVEIRADLQKSDKPGWLDRTLGRVKALLVTAAADAADNEEPEPQTAPTATPVEAPATKSGIEPVGNAAALPVPVVVPALETKPTALPMNVDGASEAMSELLIKLRDARTMKDVGEVAVAASMDRRFTIEERTVANQHIQSRRQELKQ